MNDREKIIQKIRKLLQLADNNPNENEAMAAALKVQRLIAENDVEQNEIYSNDVEKIETVKSNVAKNSWRADLAKVIADNFRCKAFIQATFSLDKGVEKRVCFIGYETDAKAATMIFNYLYRVGNENGRRLYWRKKKEYGSGKGVYNSYVLGFVDGVRKELEKQSKELMLVVPAAVKEKFKTVEMHGSDGGANMKNPDFEAFIRGREEGKDSIRKRRVNAAEKDFNTDPVGLLG